MRSAARKFLDWLDRRFPEKVVVTLKDWESLNQRLKQAESNIEKINGAFGVFGPMAKMPQGMLNR